MAKRKTVRFHFAAPAVFEVYVDQLLRRGTFGDTRSEVIRRLVGTGLMEALSGDEIRGLSEEFHAKKALEARPDAEPPAHVSV